MRLAQLVERDVPAKRLAGLDGDAADLHQPVDLGLGKVVRRLVGSDPVLVEATSLAPGVVDRDVMAMHRQPVRRRQACRPRAHNCNRLAGPGRAGKGMDTLGHHGVGGIALEPADLDRFALGHFAHADLFAQLLGRADAATHATQNVLAPDRDRRRFGRAGRDLADEQRNVDRGRAGGHAGRVMTEIAAVGGHLRLVPVECRLLVGKMVAISGGGQTSRHHAGRQLAVGHVGPSR